MSNGNLSQRNSFKIEGKIIEVKSPQRITNTFHKKIFLLEVLNEYGTDFATMPFELISSKKEDQLGLVQDSDIGSFVRVFFKIKSTCGKSNWFNNLQVIKVEKISRR